MAKVLWLVSGNTRNWPPSGYTPERSITINGITIETELATRYGLDGRVTNTPEGVTYSPSADSLLSTDLGSPLMAQVIAGDLSAIQNANIVANAHVVIYEHIDGFSGTLYRKAESAMTNPHPYTAVEYPFPPDGSSRPFVIRPDSLDNDNLYTPTNLAPNVETPVLDFQISAGSITKSTTGEVAVIWDVDGTQTTQTYPVPGVVPSDYDSYPGVLPFIGDSDAALAISTNAPRPVFLPNTTHSVRVMLINAYEGTRSPWIPILAPPVPRLPDGVEQYQRYARGYFAPSLGPLGIPAPLSPLEFGGDGILDAETLGSSSFNWRSIPMVYRWKVGATLADVTGYTATAFYGRTFDISAYPAGSYVELAATPLILTQAYDGTLPPTGQPARDEFLYNLNSTIYDASVIFRYGGGDTLALVIDSHNTMFYAERDPDHSNTLLILANYNRANLAGSFVRSSVSASAVQLDTIGSTLYRFAKFSDAWRVASSLDQADSWVTLMASPFPVSLPQAFVALGDGRFVFVAKDGSNIVSRYTPDAGRSYVPPLTESASVVLSSATGRLHKPEREPGSARVFVKVGDVMRVSVDYTTWISP